MKKKMVGILIFFILIVSSITSSVSSNKIDEQSNNEVKNTEDITDNNSSNTSTLNEDFGACVSVCLGGITLAGNCLYMVIGCAIAFGPWNPCCWAAPVLCGVDIGLLMACIMKCLDSKLPSGCPCFPPNIVKLVKFLQKNDNPYPTIIIGLWCLFKHWEEIKQWLKDHGYVYIPTSLTVDCECNKLNHSSAI